MCTSVNFKTLILTFTILSMIFLPSIVQSASPTIVYLDPSRLSVGKIYDSVELQLKISNVEKLNSWKVRVDYDPDALYFISANEGDFLKPNGQTVFFAKEGNSGSIELSCTSIFTKEYINGNGTLATISFRVLTNTTVIELDDSILSQPTNDQGVRPTIETTLEGAKLRVINPSEQKPVAIIESNTQQETVGTPIHFNASESQAPEDTMLSDYAWNFGDGTKANGENVSHAYNKAGTYNVELVVIDEWAATSEPVIMEIVVIESPIEYTNIILIGSIIAAVLVIIFLIRRKK